MGWRLYQKLYGNKRVCVYTDGLQEWPVLNLWCNACVHTHAHIHTQTTKFVYSECTVQSKFMIICTHALFTHAYTSCAQQSVICMLSVITSTGHQQSYISSVKQDTSAHTQVKAVHSLLIDKQLAKSKGSLPHPIWQGGEFSST